MRVQPNTVCYQSTSLGIIILSLWLPELDTVVNSDCDGSQALKCANYSTSSSPEEGHGLAVAVENASAKQKAVTRVEREKVEGEQVQGEAITTLKEHTIIITISKVELSAEDTAEFDLSSTGELRIESFVSEG